MVLIPGHENDITQTLNMEEKSKHKYFKKFLLLLFAAALFAGSAKFFASEKSNTVQFKTQPVECGNIVILVSATGTLEPTNQVEVGSELSGIVKSVEVDYNDRVKVGQVLARLDTSKLKAQVTQSKASLEAAKAKVLQAQATVKETHNKLVQLQKVRALSNNKVPSQIEMDAADAAFERAKADEASAVASVSQAQATLEANETDFAKAVICSPINGLVLTRSVEPGQTVAASFTTPELFVIAEDLTQMELHVNVDEADIGKIKIGQEATFTVDAYPNRTFHARIVQAHYGSQTVNNVVTYETVLEVKNSDLSLRPGMTATAEIVVKKVENAILIPNAALRFTPPVQEEKRSEGLVGSLLPRPPRSENKKKIEPPSNKRQQRVWILEDNQPSAISVTTGETDGTMTELLDKDIKPGKPLLVDVINAGK